MFLDYLEVVIGVAAMAVGIAMVRRESAERKARARVPALVAREKRSA